MRLFLVGERWPVTRPRSVESPDKCCLAFTNQNKRQCVLVCVHVSLQQQRGGWEGDQKQSGMLYYTACISLKLPGTFSVSRLLFPHYLEIGLLGTQTPVVTDVYDEAAPGVFFFFFFMALQITVNLLLLSRERSSSPESQV